MPTGTALAGELVAVDDDGTPDFNLLQNFRTGARQIQYYVFDLLCLKNRDRYTDGRRNYPFRVPPTSSEFMIHLHAFRSRCERLVVAQPDKLTV